MGWDKGDRCIGTSFGAIDDPKNDRGWQPNYGENKTNPRSLRELCQSEEAKLGVWYRWYCFFWIAPYNFSLKFGQKG